MLNINEKQWFELTNDDVEEFLNGFIGEANNDESFFFEFKDDKVENDKIVKEVCAFSNTYGGYLLIGVSDDKKIVGCVSWNEERIQNVICDSITPLPSYDVRRFEIDKKIVYVIKIDEGSRPPYITSKGFVFERISSGSRKLVNAERLSEIYKKKQQQHERLETRLRLEPINDLKNDFPNNIVAILDMGFEIISNDTLDFHKNFFSYNTKNLLHRFADKGVTSIIRLGNSLNITCGTVTQRSGDEERDTMLQAGLNNFAIIYPDGAVKTRCILSVNKDGKAEIDGIWSSKGAYEDIYEFLFPDLLNKFVYASKYEELHVIKSFRPCFSEKILKQFDNEALDNSELTNGNLIFTSGRVPSYGYYQIDKHLIGHDETGLKLSDLIYSLFHTDYLYMGMHQ